MKKSSTDGTFGAPKPLPGQAGYRMSDTDILEKEAKEMEVRLQMLQERVKQQQEEELAQRRPSASSGSIWKSSKPEKGSIRSYGKEIVDRAKTKSAQLNLSGRESVATNLTQGVVDLHNNSFTTERSSKDSISIDSIPLSLPIPAPKQSKSFSINDWGSNEVEKWLNEISLSQYAVVFSKNEITGQVLLDLTLEDLDYMGITVLGHRKILLRSVEELRRNQASSSSKTNLIKAPSAIVKSLSQTLLDREEPVGVEGEAVEKREPAISKLHWSQLEPLSSNPVKGGSAPSINAADEDLDEEAERLAFQKAVEEWRRGDDTTQTSSQKGKVLITREYKEIAKEREKPDEGMWVNPFAPKESPKRGATETPYNNNASLMDGQLDEEFERAEFRKAVESWRSGGVASSDKGRSSGTNNAAAIGDNSSISSAQSMAASLAQELEREKEEMIRKIQRQKIEAENRVKQAAVELEKLRVSKVSSSAANKYEDIEESHSKHQSNSSFDEDIESKSISQTPVGKFKVPTFNDEDDDSDVADCANGRGPPQNNVKISLVESIVGYSADDNLTEDFCVVEYASDED